MLARRQAARPTYVIRGKKLFLTTHALAHLRTSQLSSSSLRPKTLQFSLHLIRVDSYYNPSFSCLSAVVRNGEGGCYGLLFSKQFTTILYSICCNVKYQPPTFCFLLYSLCSLCLRARILLVAARPPYVICVP